MNPTPSDTNNDEDNASNPPMHEEDSSSPASSSTEEEEQGEPACKKRKMSSQVPSDPRVDALFDQVSALTNFIMYRQSVPPISAQNPYDASDNSFNDFVINPSTITSKTLDLGTCKTEFDEKKFIKPADEKRLKQLIDLQQFNLPTWRHVHYNKALHDVIAQPGFCNLKLNDELCCLNKGKDFLASTELVMAGLTNALLHQREILQSGLQSIVNWAHRSPTELNPDNLFDKISETFGRASTSYKLSEQALQITCGKRAECIETRRHRLISDISNKNIQAALSNIPPSEEFLFDQAKLTSLIHSLGGSHLWLSQLQTYKKDKINMKRKVGEPTPSTSKSHAHTKQYTQENYKKHSVKSNYKNKSSNKHTSFRNNNTKKK